MAVNSKLSAAIGLFFLLPSLGLLILCLLSGQQSPYLLSKLSFLDVINTSENATVKAQANKLGFGTWGVCIDKSSPLTSYCRSSENLAENFRKALHLFANH